MQTRRRELPCRLVRGPCLRLRFLHTAGCLVEMWAVCRSRTRRLRLRLCLRLCLTADLCVEVRLRHSMLHEGSI